MDRTMRAGAGKEEIMLMEAYLAIEDFSIVHRALDVRAVIIENGTKMAFVSVEMTSPSCGRDRSSQRQNCYGGGDREGEYMGVLHSYIFCTASSSGFHAGGK